MKLDKEKEFYEQRCLQLSKEIKEEKDLIIKEYN